MSALGRVVEDGVDRPEFNVHSQTMQLIAKAVSERRSIRRNAFRQPVAIRRRFEENPAINFDEGTANVLSGPGVARLVLQTETEETGRPA